MGALAIDDERLVRMALAVGLDAVGIAPVVLLDLMAAANEAEGDGIAVAPQGEPISADTQQEHHVRGRCTH